MDNENSSYTLKISKAGLKKNLYFAFLSVILLGLLVINHIYVIGFIDRLYLYSIPFLLITAALFVLNHILAYRFGASMHTVKIVNISFCSFLLITKVYYELARYSLGGDLSGIPMLVINITLVHFMAFMVWLSISHLIIKRRIKNVKKAT